MSKTIFFGSQAQPITSGPGHHFFGYYEKTPWDQTGRYILGMEIPFIDRMPEPDDELTVGLIDTHSNHQFRAFDTTRAWNWQQGTMLQWLPDQADRKIIYNQREDDHFISIIRDTVSGETRSLSRSIYAVSPTGRYALGLNFARLAYTRPVTGYAGCDYKDEEMRKPSFFAPEDDGVFYVDVHSGETRLLLSIAQAAQLERRADMKDALHWFEHIQINTDGSRFAVLHRWSPAGSTSRLSRLLTVNPDGSQPYVLTDNDLFSHYDWLDAGQLVGWANSERNRYYLYTDRTRDTRIIGEGILTCDGHCSFSPDRKWMLTDTYPDHEHMRNLLLWRFPDGPLVDIARFYSPPELSGPLRCDLHPRWSRDGRQICLDSAHTGQRQMYVLDVGRVVDAQ